MSTDNADRPGGLPSGTVTFLFTDVEGSTKLWAADKDAMSASLLVHDAILRGRIEGHGGHVLITEPVRIAAPPLPTERVEIRTKENADKLRANDEESFAAQHGRGPIGVKGSAGENDA